MPLFVGVSKKSGPQQNICPRSKKLNQNRKRKNHYSQPPAKSPDSSTNQAKKPFHEVSVPLTNGSGSSSPWVVPLDQVTSGHHSLAPQDGKRMERDDSLASQRWKQHWHEPQMILIFWFGAVHVLWVILTSQTVCQECIGGICGLKQPWKVQRFNDETLRFNKTFCREPVQNSKVEDHKKLSMILYRCFKAPTNIYTKCVQRIIRKKHKLNPLKPTKLRDHWPSFSFCIFLSRSWSSYHDISLVKHCTCSPWRWS